MIALRILTILTLTLAASQQGTQTSSSGALIVAVSRDNSVLTGGFSSSQWLSAAKVLVEPFVRLMPDGEWVGMGCDGEHQLRCKEFESSFAMKTHRYTVVSYDGRGAQVFTPPTHLSECNDYAADGTFAGQAITGSTIASNSPSLFSEAPKLTEILGEDKSDLLKTLLSLPQAKLVSKKGIRLFRVRLESRNFVVVQRVFTESSGLDSEVFLIGSLEGNRFQILRTRDNDQEQILNTIHLQSGHDFLISVSTDSEGHSYRIYGIKNGQLTLVFSGGGSSC